MRFFVLVFLFLSAAQTGTCASRDQTIIHVAAGSYQIDDGTHHLVGSRTAIGLKHFWDENWAWFANLEQGTVAQKFRAENQLSYLLEAQTTGLTAGVEWRQPLGKRKKVIPFVGLGLNGLSYEMDYTYPGSSVGKTSGVGFGPLFRGGARFVLGRNFILIPAYQYSAVQIQTEAGANKMIVSSGFFVGLVAVF